MPELRIRVSDPGDPAIRPLIDAHLAFSQAETPQTSCHVMTAEDLGADGVVFWAMTCDGAPVAIGALKPLDPGMAEVKSVHVAVGHRGRGLAGRMMGHIEAEARRMGVDRLVLETGSAALPGYAAARRLYERLGFVYRGPIPGYEADPNSAFMERSLAKG